MTPQKWNYDQTDLQLGTRAIERSSVAIKGDPRDRRLLMGAAKLHKDRERSLLKVISQIWSDLVRTSFPLATDYL